MADGARKGYQLLLFISHCHYFELTILAAEGSELTPISQFKYIR